MHARTSGHMHVKWDVLNPVDSTHLGQAGKRLKLRLSARDHRDVLHRSMCPTSSINGFCVCKAA